MLRYIKICKEIDANSKFERQKTSKFRIAVMLGIARSGMLVYTSFIMKDLIRTQQELSELIGCSGREETVRRYIHNSIAPYVDTLQEDAAGNLIAVKYGRNEKNDVILLDAHMDEVGFMVNHLEGDGLFRV